MKLPQLFLLILLPLFPVPAFSHPDALAGHCPPAPGAKTARHGIPAAGTNNRRTDSRSQPPESFQHSNRRTHSRSQPPESFQHSNRRAGSRPQPPESFQHSNRHGNHHPLGRYSGAAREKPRPEPKSSSSSGSSGGGQSSNAQANEFGGLNNKGPNANSDLGNNKRVTPVERCKVVVPVISESRTRNPEYESWGVGNDIEEM